ncbi:hypothetical protein Nepgr_001008 [Nepenthes gracilis]|uniref:Uncharacterized protein n=1 Tax=Nepenthes gracilis TaxID=150966 RepID=A0AAD3P7G8_NEPGR|nr:hypothetical protein Nepgr_001008 [Nepenthes gracilis]
MWLSSANPGVGFNQQQQGHQSPACDNEIPFFKGIPLKPASNSSATPAQEGNSNQLLQKRQTQQKNHHQFKKTLPV